MLNFRLDPKTFDMSIDEQFLVSSSGSWEGNEDAILGEMLLPGNPNVPGRASFYLPPPTVWKPQTLKTKELCRIPSESTVTSHNSDSFDSNGNSQPIYEILHNLVEEADIQKIETTGASTASLSSPESSIEIDSSENSHDRLRPSSAPKGRRQTITWKQNLEQDMMTEAQLKNARELILKYSKNNEGKVRPPSLRQIVSNSPKSILKKSRNTSDDPALMTFDETMTQISDATTFSVASMIGALNRESERMRRKRKVHRDRSVKSNENPNKYTKTELSLSTFLAQEMECGYSKIKNKI